jgi:hypothetical protein
VWRRRFSRAFHRHARHSHIFDRSSCSTSNAAIDHAPADSITHHGVPPPETLRHHGNPQANSTKVVAIRHRPRIPQHATQATPAPLQDQQARGLSIAACRQVSPDVPPLVPAGCIQPGRAGRPAPTADVRRWHLWSNPHRHQLRV